MADLTVAGTSGYATGSIDTASTIVNSVTATDAVQPNGLAAAIVQIETVLGVGTTLKGGTADLATRLGIGIGADGLLKLSTDASLSGTLNVSKGGTGLTAANQGKRYLGKTSNVMQAVDVFRREVFTSSGTFTCPADVVQVFVEVYGAGGGGCGGTGGNAGDSYSSGGSGGIGGRGARGGYASDIVTVTPAGTTTVTIGAAGSAGSGGAAGSYPGGSGSAGSSGGSGGTTSFGSSVVATGGTGGTSSGYDGIDDGSGTTGSVKLTGCGVSGGKGGNGGSGGGPFNSPATGSGTAGTAGTGGTVIVWY